MTASTFTYKERLAVGFLYAAGFGFGQMVRPESARPRSYRAELNDAVDKIELMRQLRIDEFPLPITANTPGEELIQAAHKLTDHQTQWRLGLMLGNLELITRQMKQPAQDVETKFGKFPETQEDVAAYTDVLIETATSALARLEYDPHRVNQEIVGKLLQASYLDNSL